MNDINGSYAMTPISERQPRNYRPPDTKRSICRDYHSAVSPFDSRHGVLISLIPDSGYCARGAYCKYSHGDDAVVPSQIFPMPGVPIPAAMSFMSMFPTAGLPFPLGMAPGAAYDPHEAQMDMRPQSLSSGSRPHNRAPLLPRVQGEDSTQVTETTRAPGELPVIQDLTPNPLPSSTPVPNEVSESFVSASDVPTGSGSAVPVQVQPLRTIPGPMDLDTAAGMLVSQSVTGRSQNFGRGRGRGHFTGEAHNFHGERRTDKTLVVEKIPEDKLSLDAVNGWFKRFGTVTNVAVDAANAKALVSFSKHEEAYAAWKSEDAVFNNRFVKIFWHRPMEGHGQVGARMLASSAPLVASMTAKESNPHSTLVPSTLPTQSVPPSAPPTPQVQKPSTPSTSISALATKQRLLEQQIAEQKSLMAMLSTATPVEKKQIMARLRKLGEEMKPSAATTPATPSPAPMPAATSPDDERQQQKERLDRELEMHNAASAVGVEVGNNTEDLKAKLEKLKAEVCQIFILNLDLGPILLQALRLGISDTTGEPVYSSGSYRPYRGRGRGTRGYFRGMGRGAMPRSSMKLDNRPKTLLIKGVPSENVQIIRDWYEVSMKMSTTTSSSSISQTTGQFDSLETVPSGDIIVTFRTRNAAEQV